MKKGIYRRNKLEILARNNNQLKKQNQMLLTANVSLMNENTRIRNKELCIELVWITLAFEKLGVDITPKLKQMMPLEELLKDLRGSLHVYLKYMVFDHVMSRRELTATKRRLRIAERKLNKIMAEHPFLFN